MQRGDYLTELVYTISDNHASDLLCDDLWPSETGGTGVVEKNNQRTGAAQGKSSLLRKAKCRLCGFPNDLTAIDHSGGSLDGEGAGGAITTATATWTVTGGATATENYGTQAYRKNAGCALCLSKNSTGMRADVLVNIDSWSQRPPLGF